MALPSSDVPTGPSFYLNTIKSIDQFAYTKFHSFFFFHNQVIRGHKISLEQGIRYHLGFSILHNPRGLHSLLHVQRGIGGHGIEVTNFYISFTLLTKTGKHGMCDRPCTYQRSSAGPPVKVLPAASAVSYVPDKLAYILRLST